MHRATPLNTSFRAYVAGGARATIPSVDDSKLMQESAGNFMANEQRTGIEAPQNYGFTSVVMDATKDAAGKIIASAESFISFMGGNRSFPVVGAMDDRRHRLINLAKGDVAMFRTVADKLQMHMNTSGWFATGPRDKTMRIQMLDEDSGQQQQSQASGHQMGLLDASSGGLSTGSQSTGQQQDKGQKARYQDAQKSFRYVELTKDKTVASGTEVHLKDANGATQVQVISGKVYLGGTSSSTRAAMKPVMLSGEELSSNVFAAGGGGFQPDMLERKQMLEALMARVAALEARLDKLEE
jgi:phage gp45-like